MTRQVSRASGAVVRIVGECLCLVAERTGKEFGELEATEWCAAFADCDPIELRQAFDNFALNSPFAPSMAAIYQELYRLRFGGISGAWLMVQQAAKECSYREFFIVFEHPAIHFAVDVIGGWFKTTQWVRDIERVGFARRDFMKAFEDYRPSVRYPAGLGGFNGRNAVLIGHQGRALEVYRRGIKQGHGSFPGIEVLKPQVELRFGEALEVWPERLGEEHMAEPPGPPIHVPPPWWGDTNIPVPPIASARDNAV